MATLTIRDESTTGKTLRETTIALPEEQVPVEELIRSYVFQRVKDANAQRAVAPSPTPQIAPLRDEITLNGTKPNVGRSINWQAEFDKTKQAFRDNQVLVFVNDEQTNSLEQVVSIGPSTDVKFLRLTMLMGG